MLERWREGIDVVYAVRQQRLGETAFKRVTARGFYRIFRRLTGLDLAVESGDFRLMDRRALDALLAMPERNRFLRGMTVWIGFTQTAVPFVRQERHAGVTKYPLRKMLRFSFDAITSFSSRAAAVGDVPRLLLQPRRVPGDPADDRRPLREHLRARRPDDDHHRPAAGRHPADHARDHRRVRRAHLRRGQAPAAVRGRRAHQRRGARRAMRIAVLGAGVAGLVAALRLTEAGPHGRRLRALARARRPGGDARRRRGPPARALLPPPVLHRPPHRGALRRAGDAGRARVDQLERGLLRRRHASGRS